jgi:hypothetical protein
LSSTVFFSAAESSETVHSGILTRASAIRSFLGRWWRGRS